MQSVPREWLDFLRQQFPKDSRIQLTEIGGNPRPISPGSTGKLDYIDDAGQFHVKWDNGCTLALVLGEDRFSVYLPEPQTFKLYMPLTADFYGRDEWGDITKEELESAQAAEDQKVYAAFHIRENGHDSIFSTGNGEEFLDVAIRLRRYLQGDAEAVKGGFSHHFYKTQPITRERFDELAALRLENTGYVSSALTVMSLSFSTR